MHSMNIKKLLINILIFFICGTTTACLFDYYISNEINYSKNIFVGIFLSIYFYFLIRKKNSQN
jgi:hypothetical protein